MFVAGFGVVDLHMAIPFLILPDIERDYPVRVQPPSRMAEQRSFI